MIVIDVIKGVCSVSSHSLYNGLICHRMKFLLFLTLCLSVSANILRWKKISYYLEEKLNHRIRSTRSAGKKKFEETTGLTVEEYKDIFLRKRRHNSNILFDWCP